MVEDFSLVLCRFTLIWSLLLFFKVLLPLLGLLLRSILGMFSAFRRMFEMSVNERYIILKKLYFFLPKNQLIRCHKKISSTRKVQKNREIMFLAPYFFSSHKLTEFLSENQFRPTMHHISTMYIFFLQILHQYFFCAYSRLL